ncbi:translation initiation factor IF-2 [Candidatus Woesearchaeota archaeon]|nr:translation initiation factor IF-2 [Candidatus Woesearchaeota archaeon]
MSKQPSHIRSPICSTLGHVDHGKSTLLDVIRGSSIVDAEAGAITQAIGASIVPLQTIQKICGPLLDALKMKFTIPGLLFIDTPGHAAFTSLRKRGGNLADLAILVVDINEGFKPQTVEALEILKNSKTPFVVAANKIDLIQGFTDFKGPLLQNIAKQHASIQSTVENKLYELVGKLSEFGINSERFDRVGDFTAQAAIIPVSAKANIGISELLMVITGLAQRYLETGLQCDLAGPAKGIVLEVKEEKGLGKTLDVILYDGNLNVNDQIVIGGLEGPIITKVKALLEPAPLKEMRDKKAKFKSTRQVFAATGVKIAGQQLDDVIAGMPLQSLHGRPEDEVVDLVQSEVDEVLIETTGQGVIVKADSIGSLEALTHIFNEKEVPVKRASIGNISKKDLVEAEANLEMGAEYAVVLGFNVTCDVPVPEHVKVITNEVVYAIIDDYDAYVAEQKKLEELRELDGLVRPCRMHIMPGYIFRQSNPAVVGVDIEAGSLKSNCGVMNIDGKDIGRIKGIQHEQKNVEEAESGKQVAISIDGATVGRQIKENDTIFSSIPEDDFIKLKEFKNLLSTEEKEVMKTIAEIKRRNNPVWGI